MATGVSLPRRLALGCHKRRPTQRRHTDETVDGSVLLLYVKFCYRPTYKPSLRGSDDDDCIDDEDWSYVTKEGDVFTRARRREDKEVHDPLQRGRRPGGRRLQKDVRHVLGAQVHPIPGHFPEP